MRVGGSTLESTPPSRSVSLRLVAILHERLGRHFPKRHHATRGVPFGSDFSHLLMPNGAAHHESTRILMLPSASFNFTCIACHERLAQESGADVCMMQTHFQRRRLFYASTIGLLILYAGALIMLILSTQ